VQEELVVLIKSSTFLFVQGDKVLLAPGEILFFALETHAPPAQQEGHFFVQEAHVHVQVLVNQATHFLWTSSIVLLVRVEPAWMT
jgi:hypothetical protein